MLKLRAWLWDGNVQLSGLISIESQKITFQFDNFKQSHLSLIINFKDIQKMEIFRLYNILPKGLRVISINGKIDEFILEDPNKIVSSVKGYSTNNGL